MLKVIRIIEEEVRNEARNEATIETKISIAKLCCKTMKQYHV